MIRETYRKELQFWTANCVITIDCEVTIREFPRTFETPRDYSVESVYWEVTDCTQEDGLSSHMRKSDIEHVTSEVAAIVADADFFDWRKD